MDHLRNFTQAYSQAPWRKQLQIIGAFLSILVVFLVAASIFISVTSQTAAVGKEIQRNRLRAEALELEIANMRSRIATLTSVATMKQRAIDMGFRPATKEDIIYVEVPGYAGNTVMDLLPASQAVNVGRPELSPAFTETWVDWFSKQFRRPIVSLENSLP